MSNRLSDEEQLIFNQKVIKGWALDYFYNYDNVPQHYAYRDGSLEGDLTELERRNKAITEELWLNAYNLHVVQYSQLYRSHALQLPLQAFIWGARGWPPDTSEERGYRAFEEVKADLDAWMDKEGWQLEEQSRHQPATEERRILLGAPDRTMRIASVMPFGNRIVAETIVTWTEAGVVKETAFAVILFYDVDGTVLIDRSYCDMVNWPSSPGAWPGVPRPQDARARQGQKKGWLDYYYNRYRDRGIGGELSEMEKRNRRLVEGPWVSEYNSSPTYSLYHPERYRVQLPFQKASYSGEISKEIETNIRERAPDRDLRIIDTYPKGNQVVAECALSWTEAGIWKETSFISFLLFDKEGLIIRDRRYINLDHWPGAAEVSKILGI